MRDDLALMNLAARLTSREEQDLVYRAVEAIQERDKLKSEKSWKSPYREAIGVLEARERSFFGSFS